MADPVRIKPEPEASSPLAEDDLDDAGDLEFYDNTLPGDPLGMMYLARMPNYVWQAWENLDDDAEIQIGTIRQWNDPNLPGPSKTRLQLRLKSDLAEHQGLPKEYDMTIQEANVFNTFLFTEQDLPGYAAKNKARAKALAQGIPAHLLRRQDVKQNETQPTERPRRGAMALRKAIPKKTAIAGRIKHELTCTPVQNYETEYLLQQRALEAMKPKSQTTILTSLPYGPNGIIEAGTERAHNTFGGFIKTAPKPESKAKRMENKTARWPENVLLDELGNCFAEYSYWSMKALRAKIPQPEAFLREVLERFAVLHRSGRFANQWSVKPEFIAMIENKSKGQGLPAADTAAPEDPNAALVDDGEDDEDIKMEDVL